MLKLMLRMMSLTILIWQVDGEVVRRFVLPDVKAVLHRQTRRSELGVVVPLRPDCLA